jgi:uncharacterized protein DUF6090
MNTTNSAWKRLAGEFVVIVIGVLVALGVDSWQQRGENRRQELVLLGELRDDLTSTRSNAERALHLEEGIVRSIELLEGGLDDHPRASSDSLRQWFQAATASSLYRPDAPTAQALIEAGGISWITDQDLRRLVIVHRGRIGQVTDVFSVLDASSLEAQARLYRRANPRALAQGRVDWEAIAGDAVFRGDLQTLSARAVDRRDFMEYLLQSIRPLEEPLEAAVAR